MAERKLPSYSPGVAPPGMRSAWSFGAAGAAVWAVAMVVSGDVRANPHWALAISPVALCVTATRARTQTGTHDIRAALGAAALAGVLIFMSAVSVFALNPRLVPDVAGTSCCAGGFTAADRAATNQVEATDPYVAELFLAGSLGGLIVLGAGLVGVRRRLSASASAE
jgi:hypothetical protein